MSSPGELPQPTPDQQLAIAAAATRVLSLTSFDDEVSPWGKFAAGLCQTMAARTSAVASGGNGPSYFCLVQRPNQYAGEPGATGFFDLEMNAGIAISDRLMLVTENANGGVSFEVTDQTALIAKLAEFALSDQPAAAFYPAANALKVYPKGFGAPEEQFVVGLHPPRPSISEADIKEVIDRFHADCLCTPQHVAPVFWEDSKKWLPQGAAEKIVQWPLKAALVLGFSNTGIVKPEEPNPVGDSDFAIYQLGDPIGSAPKAIVEVKVQKSARATGPVEPSETRAEFVRGLVQTAAYRNQTGAEIGLLACFDLRMPGAGTDAAWLEAQKRTERACKALDKRPNGCPSVATWMVFADTLEAQAAAAIGSLRSDERLYPVTRRSAVKALINA